MFELLGARPLGSPPVARYCLIELPLILPERLSFDVFDVPPFPALVVFLLIICLREFYKWYLNACTTNAE